MVSQFLTKTAFACLFLIVLPPLGRQVLSGKVTQPQLQVSLPTAKATQLLPLSAEDPAQCPTGVIPGVAVVGAHVIDLMPCRGRQLPWVPSTAIHPP